MQGHRRRLIVATVIAAVLLVPAIIWSGMQQSDARAPKGVSKIPEVATIGPAMTPYVMTAQEIEKLSLPAWSPPILMDIMRVEEPKSTIGSEGPYPGMTQAELDKLAQWRASTRSTDQAATTEQQKPFSTIVNVPRARGIEGLTPQERAKLQAYLKSRSR